MPKPNKKSRRKPPEDELEEEEEHCPHIPLMSMEDKETTKLRFAVGTEVACNTGEDWPEGRVTKQFYTQRSFPPGYCAAYQVEMHDGRLIFAPRDNDHFIGVPAAAKEAEWDAFFSEAVAAGHMSSSEIDSLSDALAELSSAGERRELIDEQIEQAHARALLLWVPAVLAVRVLSMAGARICFLNRLMDMDLMGRPITALPTTERPVFRAWASCSVGMPLAVTMTSTSPPRPF